MTKNARFGEHDKCFACGGLSAEGLGLVFERAEDKIRCRTRIDSRFQSYDGIVHGGILASIADAAMVNLAFQQFGGKPLTGSLEVRYRAPANVGEEISVEASILRTRSRIIWAVCRITVENRLCAEANAVLKLNNAIVK
jgi:uncharacterized protein (TIGR00369 family)